MCFVSGICRIEPHISTVAVEIFQRRFLIIYKRNHNLAIASCACAANECEVTIENACIDHGIARHFERIVITRTKQSRGDWQALEIFHSLDGRTCRDPTVKRYFNHIIGGLWTHGGRWSARTDKVIRGFRFGHSGGRRILWLAYNFQCASAVGQAADKAAFLQRGNQTMHSRFALQIERVLHFLERGRNSGFFQSLLDKLDQFMLLRREHRQAPITIQTSRADWRTNAERLKNAFC